MGLTEAEKQKLAHLISDKSGWGMEFTFGKHKGRTALAVYVMDKNYIAWALQEGLADTKPEVAFIRDNIKPHELSAILDMQRSR